MIEHALMSILVSNLSAPLNQRVYYMTALQDTPTPYIVFFKVSAPRVHSHEGFSHLSNPRFQFSVFATTYYEAKQIARIIQGILQAYTGESEDIKIQMCLYVNEFDTYETQTKLYHVAADYEIYHSES